MRSFDAPLLNFKTHVHGADHVLGPESRTFYDTSTCFLPLQ